MRPVISRIRSERNLTASAFLESISRIEPEVLLDICNSLAREFVEMVLTKGLICEECLRYVPATHGYTLF
jgi:hypothetical protein